MTFKLPYTIDYEYALVYMINAYTNTIINNQPLIQFLITTIHKMLSPGQNQ